MSDQCRHHDAEAAAPLSAEIVQLYGLCYSAPPWCETPDQLQAYPGKLAASLARPGFAAWTAHDDEDRLTGVCYGWPTPDDLPKNRIYDSVIRSLGAAATGALVRGAFEVAELFVHPRAQGRGIGRALLTAATADRPSAWLITCPEAPAARLYRSMGWRHIGLLPADFYPQLRLAVFGLHNRVDGTDGQVVGRLGEAVTPA
ncbi:GNAT family N-acetyltransferase [Sphaerisporangium fuscum]|uniref:GNAT family N-acetyltransferase n=1 Tax=Sphaerisporangium fuscum TaxID=2835868 RepID=UPI001BDCF404|nr:GNAT family N-acetyltransferase [Sphaerisporangium fuscum]